MYIVVGYLMSAKIGRYAILKDVRPALRGLQQTVELGIQAFPDEFIALAVSLLGVLLSFCRMCCWIHSTISYS